MKKFFYLVAAMTAMISCNNVDEPIPPIDETKIPINIETSIITSSQMIFRISHGDSFFLPHLSFFFPSNFLSWFSSHISIYFPCVS